MAVALESFEKITDELNIALSSKSLKHVIDFVNSENGGKRLLQWKLFANMRKKSCGYLGLLSNHQHFQEISWIMNNVQALELLLCSGYVQEHKWFEAIDIFCKILAMDADAKSGYRQRLAIAISLTFSTPVKRLADESLLNACKRYKSFVKWAEAGYLFPAFKELSAWQLRYVVGSWADDDELVWARHNVPDDFRSPGRIGEATHNMMNYKETNDSGISVHDGAKYYGNRPVTMAVLLEIGAVCGGISKFGCSMSQAFGIPAMPVGQPGHCAFLWWNEGNWTLSNDNAGLGQSIVHDGIQWSWNRNAEYIVLMDRAQQNLQAYVLSEKLRIAAKFSCGPIAIEILDSALVYDAFNFLVWRDLAKLCGTHGFDVDVKNWICSSAINLHYCDKFKSNTTEILSKDKKVNVSDCEERGQNIVDGTGSEWWTDKEAAWIEIDLEESCYVTGIQIQWWGTSVSKKYTLYAAHKDEPFREVLQNTDENESPVGYNSWSKLGGWKAKTSKVKLILNDGSLDPWGLGKWFGIRQVIIYGKKDEQFEVLSRDKVLRVSECQERAQNLTDGSPSEWWAECKEAWIEIDFGKMCYVESVSLQWWGDSVAREIVLSGSTDGVIFHDKRILNVGLTSELNSWMAFPVELLGSCIKLELRNGKLDQWGMNKLFGLRNVVFHGVPISAKELLIAKVKKELSEFPIVLKDLSKLFAEAGLQVVSHLAKCRVSDCHDRAQNITDGTQSEWWTGNRNAWVEIELQSPCRIHGVKIQWWGTSVSRDLRITAAIEDGQFYEVKKSGDEVESPDGYNGWSVFTGWDMRTKIVRFELENGSSDPWGLGKFFGIRQIILTGLYCS